ncbi:hypothetical protein HPC62_07000 [Thermoleptolyngbya sichuanensis A183]|uniref:Uncharacterized protein n=1 Tax=Thermoleptolyngbya sichuanensis A183 TaxID=2737172 RepID=A0A6M8BCE5_9CYAN|nr:MULTISPECIES: hypothetical protein [Thermoleptolyngbya]QKD81980.1 hypothetical protein HPC62_07000 [Thermoleptolyngbya sichuanensis A183]
MVGKQLKNGVFKKAIQKGNSLKKEQTAESQFNREVRMIACFNPAPQALVSTSVSMGLQSNRCLNLIQIQSQHQRFVQLD